jgi:hypothetical protein
MIKHITAHFSFLKEGGVTCDDLFEKKTDIFSKENAKKIDVIDFSYLMDGDFSGHVYEGYLRKDDPTGEKVNFNNGAIASYDFSSDLRNFQWGAQLGVDWKAFKHLKVFADLTWGLNDIFQKDFQTISFAMYPIYLNFGFGYAF